MKRQVERGSHANKATQRQADRTGPRTAVIYARARTMGLGDATAAEGRAAHQQLKQCEQTAGRLGAGVVEEFIDLGTGATDRERPGLAALLERITAGDVDYVIVAAPDRLARTVQDQMRLAQTFEAAGATLVVGPEGVEFSPAAEFTEAIMSVMHDLAHEERSEAAKRGWGKRRARQVAG